MGTSVRKQYVPLEHKQHITEHVLVYAVKPIVAYYQQNNTTLDVTLGKNSWDTCQYKRRILTQLVFEQLHHYS